MSPLAVSIMPLIDKGRLCGSLSAASGFTTHGTPVTTVDDTAPTTGACATATAIVVGALTAPFASVSWKDIVRVAVFGVPLEST